MNCVSDNLIHTKPVPFSVNIFICFSAKKRHIFVALLHVIDLEYLKHN
jgi:hypothetical protein